MDFSWAELRRRKVVRVAVAYVIGAWVLMQVGDTLVGLLELPSWAGKALVVALALGFPLVLVLSWMFDITPGGMEKTGPAEEATPGPFRYADPEPIDAVELDLLRPQATPLIGREQEMALLEARLEETVAGRGGLVLIGGEPGAGKTRLGEEALALGHARGMLPLVGHAYEEHGAPFVTSTEILEQLARAVPADNLRNVLGPTAGEISLLLPELRRRFPDIPRPQEVPPEQQQRYLFNALLELTERLGSAVPVAVLLDDMQWSDESTMLLLEHLAPHLPRLPVIYIVTYRDVAADMGEPFQRALARLSRLDSVSRIKLRDLGRDEVATLLASLGGPNPPAGVVEVIYRETEGNPFFVQSVYRHLAEEGRLFDAEGQWRTDLDAESLAVPEGVRLVIDQRLKRLGDGTQAVLGQAAVMGLRFELGLVEKACGQDGEDVLTGIEAAETAGLVFPASGPRSDRYEFSHALVRQTLLENLSAPRRQRLHLALADAMEAARGNEGRYTADIARHLYDAGPLADQGRTRRFLFEAGRAAFAAAAADEALQSYDKALELESGLQNEERARILYHRGVAWRGLSRWDDAARDWLEALPVFERLNEGETVARICWDLAYWLAWANRMKEAEELCNRGLAAVSEEPSVARCQLLAAFAMCAGERTEFRVWDDYIEQAIEMAEQLGEERLLGGYILTGKQYLGEHWLKGRLHAETADRAIALMRRLGSPFELSTVLGASFWGYLANGRFDDVEKNHPEAYSLGREHGDFGAEMHAQMALGLVQCYRGEFEAGRERLAIVADWSRDIDFAWKGPVLAVEAMACFWAGDWERAREITDECRVRPIEGTMAGMEASVRLLLLAYGGDTEAGALMDELQPRVSIAGQENQIGAWHAGMATLEAAAVLGMRERSAALYDCAVQLVQAGTHVVWCLGMAEKHAAIAAAAGGQWDRAEQHFDAAAERAEAIGNRVDGAELLRWRAQARLWRDGPGDRAEAAALAEAAREAYAAIGMKRHIGLAEALL
ncbi:MAG: AAA family ATPase [Lysobacterales bacterium]|jgi:tetratricopeptide (TPR) repeat protein